MNPKLKELLISRKFWSAIIGVVFVFVSEFVPSFPVTDTQVLEFVLIIAGYIGGVSLDPGAMGGNKFAQLMTSRKFWAAFLGIGFVFVQIYAPDFPIDESLALTLIGLVVAYITGSGLQDRTLYNLKP